MKIEVNKKEKSTIELKVTVPNEAVKKTYGDVLEKVVESAEIEGFRKGQAPKKLVEEKTNTSELHGEVVNELLQIYYPQALKEKKISPVSNPRVSVDEFGLEKDFEFTATIATKPEVKVKGYKKELEKLYKEKKKEFEEKNEDKEAHYHLPANLIIQKLVELSDLEVSDILVEEEVNRMFSQMMQQIQAVGMSVEDYLKSQNITVEKIKEEYKEAAERNIKAEFILNHLITEQEITVDESELEAMIQASGDEEVQKQMRNPIQLNYIRSILAKNKLIQGMIEELEPEHEKHDNKNKGEKKDAK